VPGADVPGGTKSFGRNRFVDGTAVVDRLAEIPVPGSLFVGDALRNGAASRLAAPTGNTFLVGAENRLLGAAVERILPGSTNNFVRSPGVIVFWGGTGTGKTHLAQGICNLWQQQFGEPAAEYLTAADYRHELADAVKHNAIEHDSVASLRDRLRSRKLLVIDDLHRLPREDYLNEELFHMLDALAEAGGTLLATSNQPPAALPNLSVAVASRLASGLTVSISAPGPAARTELAMRIARSFGRPIAPAAAEVIAERAGGTVRELIGLVAELMQSAELTQKTGGPSSLSAEQMSTEQIAQWLDDRAVDRRPRVSDILRVVAKYYSIPQKVLKGSSRRQSVVMARAMAIYLARRLASLSYQRIGKALSGRDHTTILHSYRKTESLAKHDLATQQALADLERLLAVP
jgi:chromosomal replication initiator protein